MDEANISDLKGDKPKGSKSKILLLGDFDPEGDRIIRDPYYVIYTKTNSISLTAIVLFLGFR